MKIKGENIPDGYLIKRFLPANYCDIFSYTCKTSKIITPDDVQVAFWTVQPAWIQKLFKIRNILVKPFGLKGEENNIQGFEDCIRNSGNYRFISVPAKSESETVLCLDDKHLRAYLSVHINEIANSNRIIEAITLVQFKNLLGYIYFYSIAPFHNIIVKKMLEYTVNQLVKE